MYYIFGTEIRDWRNSIIQAKLLTPNLQIQKLWWFTKPIICPPLVFAINSKAPRLDNYFTGTLSIELYSTRIIQLIAKAEVKHETFPVTIIDQKTKQLLPSDYKAFHLLESYPAWDKERSIVDEKLLVKKLVIKDKYYEAPRSLFRLDELFLTLIHQDLKNEFDKQGITGCTYIPVEDYRHLDFYEFKQYI